MTKEEFEQGYCKRSNILRASYNRYYVTLPCACDYEKCEGWGKVRNEPDSIKDHMFLYAPATKEIKARRGERCQQK